MAVSAARADVLRGPAAYSTMPSFVLLLLIAVVLAAPVGASPPDPRSREAARCRSAVPWQQARRHVGTVSEIKGRVAGTTYARTKSGRPTFIDVGRARPDKRRLTVVIWGRNRAAFGAPEETYRDRTICVIGHVALERGVPQIEVTNPAQIRIVM